MFMKTEEAQTNLKILRRKQVENRTGLGRSTIYLLISQGNFPSPILLGERSVGWVESEITAWIEQRIQLSRTKARTKTK